MKRYKELSKDLCLNVMKFPTINPGENEKGELLWFTSPCPLISVATSLPGHICDGD